MSDINDVVLIGVYIPFILQCPRDVYAQNGISCENGTVSGYNAPIILLILNYIII